MSQYSKSGLSTEINGKIYENVNEAITATNLNQVLQDLNDSAVNIITNANLVGLKEFDTSRGYAIGECAIYNGIIYQADVVVTPGTEFNAGNWTIVNTDANIMVGNGVVDVDGVIQLGGETSDIISIDLSTYGMFLDGFVGIGNSIQTLTPTYENKGVLALGNDNRIFQDLQSSLVAGESNTVGSGSGLVRKNLFVFGTENEVSDITSSQPSFIFGKRVTFNATQSMNSFIALNQEGLAANEIDGDNNFLWGQKVNNSNGTQSWNKAATKTVNFGDDNVLRGGSWSFISGASNSVSGYSQLIKGENNVTSTQSSYNTLIGTSNTINNNSLYNNLSGRKNTVNGQFNNVFGSTNSVTGSFNNLFGNNLTIGGDYNVSFGRSISATGTNSFYKGFNIDVKQTSIDNIVFANNSSFEKLTDCFIFGNNLNVTSDLSDTNIIISNNSIQPATYSNNTTYLNSLTLLPYNVGLTQTGPIIEMRGSTGGTAADGRSVGRVLMPTGPANNSVTVFTTACKTDSYIFLTLNGNNQQHISVTAQNTGHFTITRGTNDPITVTWFIINHI